LSLAAILVLMTMKVSAAPEDPGIYDIIKGLWSGTALITEENGMKRSYMGSFSFSRGGRVEFKWTIIPSRPYNAGSGSCEGRYEITGSNTIKFIRKSSPGEREHEMVLLNKGKRILADDEMKKIIDPVPPVIEITFISDDVFLCLDPVVERTVCFKKQKAQP
jgi:hypothetical protein